MCPGSAGRPGRSGRVGRVDGHLCHLAVPPLADHAATVRRRYRYAAGSWAPGCPHCFSVGPEFDVSAQRKAAPDASAPICQEMTKVRSSRTGRDQAVPTPIATDGHESSATVSSATRPSCQRTRNVPPPSASQSAKATDTTVTVSAGGYAPSRSRSGPGTRTTTTDTTPTATPRRAATSPLATPYCPQLAVGKAAHSSAPPRTTANPRQVLQK